MLFVKSLLRDDHEFVLIKYFASRVVRYSVKKPILVFNPQRGICNELRKYSTLYRNLEIGCTAGCRLPDLFPTADGRMIHCPEAWRT